MRIISAIIIPPAEHIKITASQFRQRFVQMFRWHGIRPKEIVIQSVFWVRSFWRIQNEKFVK